MAFTEKEGLTRLMTGDECFGKSLELIESRDFLEAQVWATLAQAAYTAAARWGA